MEPLQCLFTQYHVTFVYKTNITVVQLITENVCYSRDFTLEFSINSVELDVSTQCLLMHGGTAPLLLAKVRQEGQEAWKQFLEKNQLREALAASSSPQ